jgi:hypothetical protein
MDKQTYKTGDVVLVKARILDGMTSHGDVRIHIDREYVIKPTCCSPRAIDGYDNTPEINRQWIPVSERLPYNFDWYEVTIMDCGIPARTIRRFNDGKFYAIGDRISSDVVAWKEPSAPYSPPAPEWSCDTCQHNPVCRFVAADKYLDKDSNCCGEHYAAKE